MSIADNLNVVKTQIADACLRVNRDPASVTLVAVSKQHPVSDIIEAYNAGQRHFGENRVEEMREKHPQISYPDISWHMIGHIQSRKARDIPPYFSLVHSVDSLSLAQKLDNATEKAEKPYLEVLLQINISGEESKSGFFAVDWENQLDVRTPLWADIRQAMALPHVRLIGLMTMAFVTDDPNSTRPVFAGLRKLRDALVNDFGVELPHLSMGMTDDYMVAIEEGATIVRVGRAIFGER
ncbi:MAG: YggS family pyridoxal phosphate-dependent enzyme [bacterium]|nr:YggS family pyridoxal phosphate-dependent enzyme [bacterium]